MKRWSVVMLGLLVATSAGCGRAARSAATTTERNFCPRSLATVYVTNDNWLDMVIYVARGGSRFRLGEVTSIQSAVFQLPDAAITGSPDIYLIADPVGSSYGYVSPNIMMAPGHTIIDMRIHNVINQSTVSVGVEDPEEI